MTDLTTSITVHQAEAEKLFAGGVMIDDEYARESCGWLQPAFIRDEKIRNFWEKVQAGMDAHQAAMEVGAYHELVSQITRVVTTLDLPIYAETISLDCYLAQCGHSLSEMAMAISRRDIETLQQVARSIADESPVSGDNLPSAVDIGLEFQVMIDGGLEGRSEKTGLANLDAATGGLEKQSLTIIAARPSMGKSALAIQFCKWKAEHENKRILLFSLEMNRKSIWARIACGELRISWRDVRAGTIPGVERPTQEQLTARLESLKNKSSELMDRLEDRLLIDDTANMSMEDIWRKVGRYRPDFVVIDHLGLVSSKEPNEVLSLGQISRAGKNLAKQFDIPVVALYQLNRGTEGRDNKRPTMADIRGSGKIEENADNIFFLYRDDYYDEPKPEQQVTSKTEIIIAKFRDGMRNIRVKTQYHLEEQWFYPEARM